jgi:hypothetical protein
MANKQIHKLQNADLVYYINRDRAERQNPQMHTRYVTARSFWGASGIKEMKQELERRKNAGHVHKSAGKPRRRQQQLGFGLLRGM